MTNEIIFLIKVYFTISISMTLILFSMRMPYEFKMMREHKRTWKDNLRLVKNFLILAVGFPIIALYYGLKEF